MKVQDVMTPNPITVSPDCTIGETWRLMCEYKHTHIPVVDHHQVLGIITLKDFSTRHYFQFIGTSAATHFLSTEQDKLLHKVRVRDVMPAERGVVVIGPDAYIEQAAALLHDNNLSGVPVVDDDGGLAGIVTQTDIVGAFMELMAIKGKGARITLRVNDDPSSFCTISQILCNYHVRIENLVTMKGNNGDKPLMVLRINDINLKPIVTDLKAAGFEIESTLVQQ